MDWLTTTDDTKRMMMEAVANRVVELRDKSDVSLAAKIANSIWGALKK
jgi:hypothetical protein